MFVFASVSLALGWLTPGETIAESTGDKPTSQPALVAGKEVAHWSGLPLWGEKEAREFGFDLPFPLGISGNVFSSTQNFNLPKVGLGGQHGGLVDVSKFVHLTNVKVQETAWTSRFDSWVLPFLNVYGVVGYVDGRADIEIRPFSPPMLPAFGPKFDLNLEFEGPTAGFGSTLAAGFKPFKERPTIVFGLADLNFTKTFLDFEHVVESLDPVGVTVFSARLGAREPILKNSSLGDLHLGLWGGTMYQGVQEVMTGRLGVLDTNFRANVKAVNPWNTLIGGRLEIGRSCYLTVEFGMGDRKSVMLEATFRF